MARVSRAAALDVRRAGLVDKMLGLDIDPPIVTSGGARQARVLRSRVVGNRVFERGMAINFFIFELEGGAQRWCCLRNIAARYIERNPL